MKISLVVSISSLSQSDHRVAFVFHGDSMTRMSKLKKYLLIERRNEGQVV